MIQGDKNMVKYEDLPQLNPEEQTPASKKQAHVSESGAGNAEKIKKLFGCCFEISKFEEGDCIPIGSEGMFCPTGEMINIIGDFESFEQFLSETSKLADEYDLAEIKQWLGSKGADIDEKLFAVLRAFTENFQKKYPDNPQRGEVRRKILNSRENKEIKLSDIFGENGAECAEIAALVQAYLQKEGISSTYFSGHVLWRKSDEYSDMHTFIIIRQDGKVYIYDPANPTSIASETIPSVFTAEANFDEEMAKKQNRFVTAKNIFDKKEVFYGVSDCTSVKEEKHII